MPLQAPAADAVKAPANASRVNLHNVVLAIAALVVALLIVVLIVVTIVVALLHLLLLIALILVLLAPGRSANRWQSEDGESGTAAPAGFRRRGRRRGRGGSRGRGYGGELGARKMCVVARGLDGHCYGLGRLSLRQRRHCRCSRRRWRCQRSRIAGLGGASPEGCVQRVVHDGDAILIGLCRRRRRRRGQGRRLGDQFCVGASAPKGGGALAEAPHSSRHEALRRLGRDLRGPHAAHERHDAAQEDGVHERHERRRREVARRSAGAHLRAGRALQGDDERVGLALALRAKAVAAEEEHRDELRQHDDNQRDGLDEVEEPLLVRLEGRVQEEHDDKQAHARKGLVVLVLDEAADHYDGCLAHHDDAFPREHAAADRVAVIEEADAREDLRLVQLGAVVPQ